MKVLVTGGAGYIGSTICTYLRDKGAEPIIMDSLVTGNPEFVRDFPFYKADIADKTALQKIKDEHPDVQSVIHCAARILVTESTEDPYLYYRENVVKSTELFKNCADLGIRNIIFSSSASVYGTVEGFLATEDSPTNPDSPYARTKLMMEMVLKDFCGSLGLSAVSLRYFNPVGSDPCHETGLYVASPTHIIGKLLSVASGKEDVFKVCGTDYPTRDGTGVRDYIHVWDVARAHYNALHYLVGTKDGTYDVVNLGTGEGTTVREFVKAFEKAYGKKVPTMDADRRPGDPAGTYASCEKAAKVLGWKTEASLSDAIKDALVWAGIQ